jgi:hypothetical protein
MDNMHFSFYNNQPHECKAQNVWVYWENAVSRQLKFVSINMVRILHVLPPALQKDVWWHRSNQNQTLHILCQKVYYSTNHPKHYNPFIANVNNTKTQMNWKTIQASNIFQPIGWL